jgi:hypothetical protein
MNGGSLIYKSGSLDICKAPALQDATDYSDWQNWRTTRIPDGPRVAFTGQPLTIRQFYLGENCPGVPASMTTTGKQYDYVIKLKDSGDGKAPTTVYIGKHSVKSYVPCSRVDYV